MASIWSFQPFKSVFIVLFACRKTLYLTFSSLQYFFAPLRPVSAWSFKTSIGVKILRAVFEYCTATRYQRPPQLSPGKSQERFVLIDPPDTQLFSGVLSPGKVKPVPVGAIWHPTPVLKDVPGLETRKVAILAPGGAFVLGWDPEETGRAATYVLSRHLGTTNVLYVQYRLAGPGTQFPAAVQDLLTAYHYVLGLGIPAENISLVGDSAGGNLVLALLRFLETAQTPISRPGRVLCFSPWVDVALDSGLKYEQSAASRIDLLDGKLLTWGASAYIPDGELSASALAFISPLHHPFATKTSLFIAAGGVEGLFGSICKFAEQMSGVEGTRVRLHVAKYMPHDFFLTYPVLGSESEIAAALEDARRFFDRDQQEASK
ncbi:Alpha/Beta hydrolase protein [Xylaria scruposa]|nr:Alpha/Beta hydrolase protein [Xylaria scruposa]